VLSTRALTRILDQGQPADNAAGELADQAIPFGSVRGDTPFRVAKTKRMRRLTRVAATATALMMVVTAALIGSPGPTARAADAKAIRVASSNVITDPGTGQPTVVLSMYEDALCPYCRKFEHTFGATIDKHGGRRQRREYPERRAVRAGPRVADPSAHRAEVQHAVVGATERMREYIQALQAIWHSWQTGDKLDFRGEYYQHTLMTPMFSPGPSPWGPPPVMVAAVGPKMTSVAAEAADGLLVRLSAWRVGVGR
jgi:hypothetical protein